MLPLWHVKKKKTHPKTGHCAKSADGRLYQNKHIPLTQRCRSGLTMLSKHSVGTYKGKELTNNSSGNTRLQSSQLAELLWTDPGVRSEISSARPDLHFKKKKKKRRRGMHRRTRSALIFLAARKKPPPPPPSPPPPVIQT